MKYLIIGVWASVSCYGSLLAEVNCGAGTVGGPGTIFVHCANMQAMASVQLDAPMWPAGPGWDGDFADAGPAVIARKFQTASTALFAEAQLDSFFELTFTLAQPGAGFFIPCVEAISFGVAGIASASFAGVSTSASGNSATTSCASPNLANAMPFTSGVPQVFEGIFVAHTTVVLNEDEMKAGFLYSFLVYDAGGNPLSPGDVRMSMQVTPEPTTLLLIPVALLGMVIVRRRLR